MILEALDMESPIVVLDRDARFKKDVLRYFRVKSRGNTYICNSTIRRGTDMRMTSPFSSLIGQTCRVFLIGFRLHVLLYYIVCSTFAATVYTQQNTIHTGVYLILSASIYVLLFLPLSCEGYHIAYCVFVITRCLCWTFR